METTNKKEHNILIVDDRPENVFSLENMLSQEGRNFYKAYSGNEALKIAYKENLSLILLDVQMPEMDGFETAEFLKSNAKTKKVPIIFVTAINKETRYVMKGLEEGAIDYLFKPLNTEITRAKVNNLLHFYQQQIELEHKNIELARTLVQLKETQLQLVQQEKLASLGALTAGIAHEIKNPLNFVTNFAELSIGLIEELENTTDEEERKEIFSLLKENNEKINYHGKRADSIVKNMLDHSRTGKGEKQPADINVLCEEFMSLAFHGMRATNPEFNCEIKKELGSDIPKINIVAQDISRVVLNLFNNAFYAVKDKAEKQIAGYKPEVSFSTMLLTDKLIILTIRDNGNGIPNSIRQKIFEPFFTTKPTGEGTGLGLSLSHDIVQAHGGEITVDSKDGEFTEFKIVLPVNSQL